MNAADVDGFFAARAALDAESYLELDYTFECRGDPRAAAAHLCSEQSTAQWARVGVDEDFRPRFAAKVVALQAEPIGEFSLPLPGTAAGTGAGTGAGRQVHDERSGAPGCRRGPLQRAEGAGIPPSSALRCPGDRRS